MKKVLFSLLLMAFGITAMAQQSIQLRSTNRAECVNSDMRGLRASFSFSAIDARTIETPRGDLSEIYIEGAYPNGNVGEPQLPMITRLIAIPTGATPIVSVGAHSETQYTLSDYGIGTVAAMQAPVRKNVDPSTVEYAFSEEAYARNNFNDDPIAMVEVLGTMRGITLGRLIVQPVRYNPVAGTVKVFNDIEVNVDFENGDAEATERMFKSTANVAFQSVYDQIFNIDMLMGGPSRDAYTDHPDFYNTPVKMLVICYSGFKNNDALNNWLQWKLQKGYYVDIFYTDETGTTATNIKNFITTKYNASVSDGNAYTYLIVIGDTGQVPQYMNKNIDSDIGNCASDLGYAAVNFTTSNTTNYFPDMYYSRMSVENTTHLTNYINKVLTYEKYEFSDGGNYLNNVILVGGWDSNWTPKVAKPTINYGTNYYFKSSNTTYGGFGSGTIRATVSTSSSQGYSGSNNGVYQGINNGVCFLNYTAHGDKQEWTQPLMTAAQVATLSNTGKYFFGIGNCCLTGNFNSTMTTYSPGSAIGTNACFAETMIRVPNAGAVVYLGCSPYSYWYEDFYWAVGAHSYSAGNYPTNTASSKGVYDIMFEDQYWNSASALLYLGNLAVQQAVTNGNQTSSITDGNTRNSAHYYFQFYHTFGDGSVMPYITKPETNSVTIPSTVTPGTTSITVNALAGSYVAVTDNSSVIYGVAEANSNGVATVNFTNAIPSSGTLYVVVTRQQYQPYFGTISVVGGTQYTITATANPTEGGTVSGSGQYYENTECTLTAEANHGYAFTNWTKGSTVVSTEPIYTFTVTSGGTYKANFTALTQHHITYAPEQTHGTINVTPTDAYAGDIITLSATPASGYCLYQWDVNTVGRGNVTVTNNQFVMPDSDVTISASFREGHTVTIASVMNGTISATPTTALTGETITLTATPASGYNFDHWDVFKTGAPSTTVNVSGNSFSMPDYDVTVSAVFSQPQVGEVTIGSGTTTTSGNYLPTNVYYKYSLSQQIYTKTELGEAGTITQISFYYNSSTNSGDRTLDIFMSHTSSSTISSWVTESASHLVFSNTHNFTQGWNTITLGTPFEYNGTSNILLTVEDNTNDWDVSSTTYFYTYSTGSNRAIAYYNDTNNPSATSSNSMSGTTLQYNNQIKLTKEVPSTVGAISVAPTSLSGFNAVTGVSASDPQGVSVIGNNLQTNLTVTVPSGYELSTSQNGSYANSLNLTPSSGNIRQMVYVRLKSTVSPGTYTGNMTLASGSVSATVSLSGTAIAGSGEQYTITATANPTAGGTVSGGGTYYENLNCTLTAMPNDHYTFSGWQLNGSVVSTSASYTFPVTGNANYTALFTLMPHYNVNVVQVEGGTITADVATAYPGDVVNLNISTNNGYFFVEWDVKDANNQIVTVTDNQFTMPESNVTVTAVLTQGFNVTLEQTANGTISADHTVGLQPGDVVTLTATPNNGCVFLAWYVYKTGDPRAVISVVNDSWFFMPSSDVTVQAIFVTEEEHEQTIGSGSNTSSYLPTYVYRRNICHSLTQQIYTAAEIGYNGRITAIAFKASGSATRTIDVYMAHTDKTAFSSTTDWEVMGSVAKVFSGSVSFTNNWTTITLDTPFEYDGTSNLNICVVDGTTTQVGNSSRTFNVYNTGSNRALYAYSTGSSATDFSSVVGYSNQLESTTGTYSTSNNQIKFTIKVPGSAESLTVSPGEINDFSYEEGQGPSTTNKIGIVGVELSNNITVTAPTSFEVCLTEDGTYSNSVTISPETSKRNRSVTIWDFEDGLQGWTVVDVDGDGYNWAHSTDFEGHDGSTGLVYSQSYDNSAGVLTPDNWMISPQVTLGGSFSMWAHPQQAAYPAEHFAILVSTTNTDVSSFTLLGEWTLSSGDWKQFSVDLSAFSGQNGYIAVRHFNCSDQFYINVDDFVLDTDAAITIEMPVTITPATVYVRMKENLDAGEYNGTLTASAGSGDNLNSSISLSGTVTRSNYWTPVQVGPNTMTVIAQVQVDGVPVTPRSQWELGAFCGTECRGSVIGLDDEPVFFLTVYGNEGDQNTFLLYDRAGEAVSQGVCYFAANYHDNDVIGTYENPVILNFVTTPVFTKDIIGYTPNTKDRYYLVASPIGTVSPTNVTNMLSNAYDLYFFDQNDELEWNNYENSTFNLVPGKGYLYANSQNVTLTFSGNPYYGNGEVTLEKAGNVSFSGWNLVGNPFAQTAYIDREFYTMNEDGTEVMAGIGNSVEPMEGVFVIAANDGETMTFSTGVVSQAKGQIVLNVNNTLGNTIDRAIVHMGEGDVLPKFMLNENNTKVYIPQGGKDYAVIRGEEMGEIPVSFKAAKNGSYTMNVNAEEVNVQYLHLIDNKTGADVDVLRTPSYTFDANTADYASRFKLVFVCGDANANDNFAFFTNGSWFISNDGEAILQVVDVTGRIMSSRQIEGAYNLNLQAAHGVYMFRLIKGDNVKVQKIVVE